MYKRAIVPTATFKRALLSPASLSMRPVADKSFIPLEEKMLPQKGDLVAIDAEFVSLRKEDAEIRRYVVFLAICIFGFF
jgi:hypothetical protein